MHIIQSKKIENLVNNSGNFARLTLFVPQGLDLSVPYNSLRVWTCWTPVGNTAIATYLEKVLKKSSDNNNILNLIYLWLTPFQSSYIVLFKNAFFKGRIFTLMKKLTNV